MGMMKTHTIDPRKYSFETTEGVYQYSVSTTNPDNIIVTAPDRLLIILLGSLELAGVEEGRFFEDYEIQEPFDVDDEDGFLELTKADFCLFLNFEVLNYID